MNERPRHGFSRTGNYGKSGKGDYLDSGPETFAVGNGHRQITPFQRDIFPNQEIVKFRKTHIDSKTDSTRGNGADPAPGRIVDKRVPLVYDAIVGRQKIDGIADSGQGKAIMDMQTVADSIHGLFHVVEVILHPQNWRSPGDDVFFGDDQKIQISAGVVGGAGDNESIPLPRPGHVEKPLVKEIPYGFIPIHFRESPSPAGIDQLLFALLVIVSGDASAGTADMKDQRIAFNSDETAAFIGKFLALESGKRRRKG